MTKPKVIIVGKLPPPFIGPAVATKIILESKLSEQFDLLHLNTTVNKSVEDFGKGGLSKVFVNLNIYISLVKLILKNRPNLILIPISQTTLGFLKDAVFIWIAYLLRTKILLQLRGSNYKNWMRQSNSFTRGFVQLSLKRAKGIIVLGNNLRHLFEKEFKPSQIHVVPNGCDITIPEVKKESKEISLLYFANFLPSKGIKEILEALIILKEKSAMNFSLKAVGAWDNDAYKAACLRLVEESKLPVIFSSPKSGEEKWKCFAEADIFLFVPNQPEGHPWVVVEALSAGLPIISSDQGAIIESVMHEQNGYIVNPKSANEIAKHLEILLKDSNKIKRFSKKSREHYLNNFTEQQMVKKLANAFNKSL